MPRTMRAPECGNIFLLAVSSSDGRNLVSQRHNVVSGKVAASDTAQILREAEYRRKDRGAAGDEFQFEGRGIPAGVKVYTTRDRSLTFVVVADVQYPDRNGYQLLREFQSQIVIDYGDVLHSAEREGGATSMVERVTTALLIKYDDIQSTDKVQSLQAEVSKVKQQMGNNIEQQMANMESAEELESKSLLMRDQASDFKAGSTKLKKKMWWKNCKMNACIMLVVLVVGGFIAMEVLPDSVTEAIPVVG